jgi:hypothetical protein
MSTIGDGSCLIHAVLQAFSDEYNKLNNPFSKSLLAREVRFHLSEVLELPVALNNKSNNVYQELSRGELEKISKEVPDASLKSMKNQLNSYQFLTFHYVELLSEIFDINIIFISQKERDFYYSGDFELLIKKKRDSIFVNYIDQAHYETIKVNGKTLFGYDEIIIKDCLKILKKN